MNLPLKSTSLADALSGITAHITVHNVLGDSAAFAVSDHDGGQVYIPRTICALTKPQIGDRLLATLVPNRLRPDQTPWFAQMAVPADNCRLTMAGVLELLRSHGGVWTPVEVAGEIGDAAEAEAIAPEALALLEGLYHRGEIGKFLEVRSGMARPGRVWYSAFPERADVSEWEE